MRARLLTFVLAAAAALAACEGGGEPPLEAVLGGLVVRVESRPARLVVAGPDGAVLLDGAPGGAVAPDGPPLVAAAVRHADATYESAFGSFKIEETETTPWRGVTAFAGVRREGDSVRFRLRGGDADLGEGVIAAAGDGQLTVTFAAAGADVNRVSAVFACRPGEHFLGFGGQSFDVDHRGRTVPIWVQEDGIGKEPVDDYDVGLWQVTGRRHSTHTGVPIYVSSRGYAVMLETPFRSRFALCSEAEDAVRIEAWEPTLTLRLFYGPSAKEAITRLTAAVGRPALPPAYAFAPWVDAIFGSVNVRRVAERLRRERIPAAVIWTEDWRGGAVDAAGYTLSEEWDIDRSLYPDFEALCGDLHGLGFKLLTYNNTFLTAGTSIYDEALALGYSIKDATGNPYLFTGAKFVDASLVDLTSPAAVAWTKEHYRAGLRLGADGYMADFGEWLPVDAVLASGESAASRHNLYPVDYQRLNRELLDEVQAADGVERLFFVRSAYLGSQPLVSVVWGGDQQTDFTVGDGLPSVIPIGLGLGVVGFPYYGHDIAGYASAFTKPSTRELWFRWASLGALSPVMRTHHGKSASENWSWESDDASTAHFKRWATLHLQLWPYLYALGAEAAQTGVPIMRPLALEFPDFDPGWALTDQYLLGDRVLVAPVVTEGAAGRLVMLPPGAWYRLEGGPALDGGGAPVEVAAPIEEAPVFVPAGTVLVLLPDRVDTVVAATAAGVTSLADVGEDREIWLYPGDGPSGIFTEATGLSYEWTAGALAPPYVRATWNGIEVPLVDGTAEVVGSGTFEVNGVATLRAEGGAVDRRLTIRLR